MTFKIEAKKLFDQKTHCAYTPPGIASISHMRTAASPRQKHALLGLSYVARRSLRAPHFRRSRSRRMASLM